MPLHYGLIGHPLGHSLSPFIHRRLFALQGREGSYTLQDLEPSRLKEELPALLEQMAGLNVTIPYKQEVLPFLDTLDSRAALYRSVNTIAVTGNQGRPVYTGYNTDADGFRLSLAAAGIPLAGRVALLGCGGVSRTFACEAALAGCAVVDAVRDPLSPRALQLREDVERLVPGASFELVFMGGLSGDFDLLINGTPVGMTPHPEGCPVGREVLSRTAAVFDAIYNPARTRLLQLAEAEGARTLGGMPMLVWQAVQAHTCWYGASFRQEDIEALCQEAEEELARRFGGPGEAR